MNTIEEDNDYEEWEENITLPFNTDENDKDYYSFGMCHVFAIALVEQNPDFVFKIIKSYDDNYILDNGDEVPSILHVYAEDKKNNICWDIYGGRPSQYVLDEVKNRFSDESAYESCDETLFELLENVSCYSDGDYIDKPLSEYDESDIKNAKEIINENMVQKKTKSFEPSL